jgi:hypothetical protein
LRRLERAEERFTQIWMKSLDFTFALRTVRREEFHM